MIAVILCVLVSVVAGTTVNYKLYRQDKMTKKAFVTNLVTVVVLMIVGSALLSLK